MYLHSKENDSLFHPKRRYWISRESDLDQKRRGRIRLRYCFVTFPMDTVTKIVVSVSSVTGYHPCKESKKRMVEEGRKKKGLIIERNKERKTKRERRKKRQRGRKTKREKRERERE